MNKIKLLAKRCRVFFTVLAILWVLFALAIWFCSQTSLLNFWGGTFGIDPGMITLTPITRSLGFLVTLLPIGTILYITYLLIKLLKNYEQSYLFTLANARTIRKLGLSLYLWAFCNIIFKTLLVLVLTTENPPHQKLLTLSLTGMDIQSLVVGSVILLLSWVMIEAQIIAEDNALIP